MSDGRVIHRLPQEVAEAVRSHAPREIHSGDRYDRILRQLLGGVNWSDKNPRWCPREWVNATTLVLAALSPEIDAVGTEIRCLPISTYVSGCRLHLGVRWPGMGIDRRPVREGRRGMYEYRIASRTEMADRRAGEKNAKKRRGHRPTQISTDKNPRAKTQGDLFDNALTAGQAFCYEEVER